MGSQNVTIAGKTVQVTSDNWSQLAQQQIAYELNRDPQFSRANQVGIINGLQSLGQETAFSYNSTIAENGPPNSWDFTPIVNLLPDSVAAPVQTFLSTSSKVVQAVVGGTWDSLTAAGNKILNPPDPTELTSNLVILGILATVAIVYFQSKRTV